MLLAFLPYALGCSSSLFLSSSLYVFGVLSMLSLWPYVFRFFSAVETYVVTKNGFMYCTYSAVTNLASEGTCIAPDATHLRLLRRRWFALFRHDLHYFLILLHYFGTICNNFLQLSLISTLFTLFSYHFVLFRRDLHDCLTYQFA